MTKLPSELLELAITDLRMCIASGYVVDMYNWYNKTSDHCAVCLAGADTQGMLFPTSFDEVDKFRALNFLRTGDLHLAFKCLNKRLPDILPREVQVATYEDDDPEAFFADMDNLVQIFKELEL